MVLILFLRLCILSVVSLSFCRAEHLRRGRLNKVTYVQKQFHPVLAIMTHTYTDHAMAKLY